MRNPSSNLRSQLQPRLQQRSALSEMLLVAVGERRLRAPLVDQRTGDDLESWTFGPDDGDLRLVTARDLAGRSDYTTGASRGCSDALCSSGEL